MTGPAAALKAPRAWTAEELRADAATAVAAFIVERTEEPAQNYLDLADQWRAEVAYVVENATAFLADRADPRVIGRLFGSDEALTALRYIAAPPISQDDIETIADVGYSPRVLTRDPVARGRVRSVLERTVDPLRFGWIAREEAPTREDLDRATMATLILLATQRTQTERRNHGMREQEAATKAALGAAGFVEGVAPGSITREADWPRPGTWVGERTVGGTRADVIACLRDGRLLPIECKASNSTVNSYKRIVHEAGGKSARWLATFPGGRCVPAAVISGVIAPNNVSRVQEGGMAIFWSHRLQDLTAFAT